MTNRSNTRYKTTGVCAVYIEYDLDDKNCIHNVRFTGGCSGNTRAIAALVEGMPADEAIRRLQGIQCGNRGTSCGDQLARAVQATLNPKNKT